MEHQLVETVTKIGMFSISFAVFIVVVASLVLAVRCTAKRVYVLAAWVMFAGWAWVFIVGLVRNISSSSVHLLMVRLDLSVLSWNRLYSIFSVLSLIGFVVLGSGIILFSRPRSTHVLR